jgi:hypothetical protein
MQRAHLAFIAFFVFVAVCVCPGSAIVTLSMGLTDSPDPVMPGNQITYTITATNANSATEISSPTILFAYDPNLDYLSGSPLSNQEFQGNPVTNPAFWTTIEATETDPGRIVEIAPGGSYVITVITRVKPETPCGTPIVSTATINDPGDGGGPSSASATTTTATTCGIPAPEFPSPAIPVTILVGLVFGVLAVRSRVK